MKISTRPAKPSPATLKKSKADDQVGDGRNWRACWSWACDLGKARDNPHAAARDYVELSLTIGERKQAISTPITARRKFRPRPKRLRHRLPPAQLIERTDALLARVAKLSGGADGLDARRARFLTAQLTAAKTRLRMPAGEKLSFEEEAVGLFGVRPRLQPLTSFEPVLAKIEALVPGSGPLAVRVEAFQSKFTIPPENVKAAFDAAIAECKARTTRHIALAIRN